MKCYSINNICAQENATDFSQNVHLYLDKRDKRKKAAKTEIMLERSRKISAETEQEESNNNQKDL